MADKRTHNVKFHADAGLVEAEILVGGLVQCRYIAALLKLAAEDPETIADDVIEGSPDPNAHDVSETVDDLDRAILSWTCTLSTPTANDDEEFSITVSYWQRDPDDDMWFELEGSPLLATGTVADEPTLSMFTIFESAQS